MTPKQRRFMNRNPRTMKYADFLESKYWRRVRAAVFKRYGRRCSRCGRTRMVQVHHATYEIRGQELKGDNLKYLVPLCRVCHEEEHGLRPTKLEQEFHDLMAGG
jgi:5-methylcytosine-specific restriction endonuclease McrA